MLLPAQAGPGQPGVEEPVPGLDRELAYWLGERAPRVRWVFPPAIERALARNALPIRIRALAVQSFHRAEVQIIGDPLFGDLRSIGALVDARYALVPVAAAYVEEAAVSGRVEISIALIDTIGGRVLWFGVVAGERGPRDSATVVATAAQALARVVVP
jgi:hypothetical protein